MIRNLPADLARHLARHLARRLWRRDEGSSTVEFVIVAPMILVLMFSAIDFGMVMLRQVFLDRSVDMVVREVRLGRVPAGGGQAFRQMICNRTFMLPNCINAISVEMRPVDTVTWAGLTGPAQCINREEDIAPALQFQPNQGAQVLMLLRVCIVADPFIDTTGMVMGMTRAASGGFNLVARAAWVNEPP